MRRILTFSVFLIPLILATGTASAHPGALDGNGCHYDKSSGQYHCHKEVKPNRKVDAVAKKSRENVCHDKSSSNYKTLRYFIAYKSMAECLASGGRAAG